MNARKIVIWIRGDYEAAAEEAFDEVVVRLKRGNVIGADFNETSGFYFQSGQCPDDELPLKGELACV